MDFRRMLLLVHCYIGCFIIIGLTLQTTGAESKVYFPYNLVEAHHAIAGRVSQDAYHGQRVVAILEAEGHGEEEPHEEFLKVNREKNTENKARTKTPLDITMPSGNPRPTPTAHRHTQSKVSADMTTDDTFSREHNSVEAHFNVPTTVPGHSRMGHMILPDFTEGTEPHSDHTIHIVHKRNVVASNNPSKKIPTVVTTEIVVMETTAFAVDKEGYIFVNDTLEIEEKELIEFFVLLEDISTRRALSNPLPFIIYVDRPKSDTYPAVPAVFAGVLVLIVVFFAFMIPFVIRAKRRVKQGKPVFKLGSQASSSDLTRVDTLSDMTSRDSEANFLGPNAYYNYAAEVNLEKSHFGRDLKEYTRSHPPTLQLKKKSKYPSDESSSSGVDLASQGGAEGTIADETASERL